MKRVVWVLIALIGPLAVAQSTTQLETQILSLLNDARARGVACRVVVVSGYPPCVTTQPWP